ncbi:potassium-transporting ATPase subunit C [Oleiharenicola lentus]|uniref:potassium-transporting ATPase subunit C n=1 Tax=Oleiharenicola lentus TaxID=2508720 RepID=UPI003F67A988
MKILFHSLRVLLGLTILTGLAYPLAVWAVGHVFFREAAEGSLITHHGKLVGSTLLAQKTTDARYFTSRPSTGDYATVASGASNQAWTSAKLAASIAERRAAVGGGDNVPTDLLTASGSGLDPELSVEAVLFQADAIAAARRLSPIQRHALDDLIARHIEKGQFGPSRINILELNLALDVTFPPQ